MSTTDARNKLNLETLPGKNMARVLSVMEMFGLEAVFTKKRNVDGVGFDFSLQNNSCFNGKLRCLENGEVDINIELRTTNSLEDPSYVRKSKVKTDKDRLRLSKDLEQNFRFMGFTWQGDAA